MKNETIVISLGGSLIIGDNVMIPFLKDFVSLIKTYVEENNYRFVIITGGGKICRTYNLAAEEIGHPSKEDLDWIGIASTRLNAELLRASFGEIAYKEIISNPHEIPETDKSIIIGSGWIPGCSSDNDAVIIAEKIGAKKVINLSNVNYVYDKDPRQFADAKPITSSSWEDFRKLLPSEWTPGLNSPFDPIAAEKAEKLGLTVVTMNGKNIENFKNFLDGKEFVGTIIKE